jgi:uncharacterized coiled-coil DUF342 family protein
MMLAMRQLNAAVQGLMNAWHGQPSGATKALADVIQQETDEDVFGRLGSELAGRLTWDVVCWVVDYCCPPGAPADWKAVQLEVLAGLWQAERGTAPPGYLGRPVIDAQVVDAGNGFAAAADTADPEARTIRLQRERDEAEELARRYRREADELHEAMTKLRAAASDSEASAAERTAAFARDVGTLAEHLRRVTDQLDQGEERIAGLVRQIDELRELGEQLRRERDNARDRVDELYQRVEDIRRAAEDAEARLRGEMRELEADSQRLRNTIRDMESAGSGVTARQEFDELLKLMGTIDEKLDGSGRRWSGRSTLRDSLDDDPWAPDSGAPPGLLN